MAYKCIVIIVIIMPITNIIIFSRIRNISASCFPSSDYSHKVNKQSFFFILDICLKGIGNNIKETL